MHGVSNRILLHLPSRRSWSLPTPARRWTRSSTGQLVCGVNTGLAGFSAPTARATGPGSTSTSAAPSPPPCWATEEGGVRAAQRAAALHRAAVGRDRHPVAQHHLDADARRLAGPRLRGHHLLRRPGLHGAARRSRSTAPSSSKGATVCVQSGTTTEKNLADYFARQQHADQAGRVRELRGDQQRLLRRPLPGLHDRHLGASPRSATRKRRTPTTT